MNFVVGTSIRQKMEYKFWEIPRGSPKLSGFPRGRQNFFKSA